MKSPKLYLAATGVCLLSTATVHALGVRNPAQDAKATARGEAFIATADNPSAIYYNPAGTIQLDGDQVSIGTYVINLKSEYTSLTGVMAETNNDSQVVPHFFYTHQFSDKRLVAGLGIYAPYGLSNEYRDTSPFRTVAKKGSIRYITFAPTLAFEILPNLSLGGGVTYNYAEAELTRGILVPGDESKFEGDDRSIAYKVGLLWKPHPKHSFGVTYQSASQMNFHGTLENREGDVVVPPATAAFAYFPARSATATFEFPQSIAVGYSFKPTPAWNLEINYDWTDWESLNDVVLRDNDGVVIQSLPFNWKSSAFYQFGISHYFNEGWTASVGYIYSENSVRETDFSPLVPDSERHIFSAGLGYKSNAWNINIAYQYAHGPDRTISKSISPSVIGETANGTYEFNSHAISLDVGVAF